MHQTTLHRGVLMVNLVKPDLLIRHATKLQGMFNPILYRLVFSRLLLPSLYQSDQSINMIC